MMMMMIMLLMKKEVRVRVQVQESADEECCDWCIETKKANVININYM